MTLPIKKTSDLSKAFFSHFFFTCHVFGPSVAVGSENPSKKCSVKHWGAKKKANQITTMSHSKKGTEAMIDQKCEKNSPFLLHAKCHPGISPQFLHLVLRNLPQLKSSFNLQTPSGRSSITSCVQCTLVKACSVNSS